MCPLLSSFPTWSFPRTIPWQMTNADGVLISETNQLSGCQFQDLRFQISAGSGLDNYTSHPSREAGSEGACVPSSLLIPLPREPHFAPACLPVCPSGIPCIRSIPTSPEHHLRRPNDVVASPACHQAPDWGSTYSEISSLPPSSCVRHHLWLSPTFLVAFRAPRGPITVHEPTRCEQH